MRTITGMVAGSLLLTACGGDTVGDVVRQPDGGHVPPDPVVKAKYDGMQPNSLILGHDGYLYGTTFIGGDYGYGSVFRVSPDGVETVIHSFSAGPTEGANPVGLIQGSDGNLYGTTEFGGTGACPRVQPFIVPPPGDKIDYSGCGTVFKVSLRGELTVLHAFTGGADGKYPIASLVEVSKGHFYGAAAGAGLSSACFEEGCGVVFAVTGTGNEQTIYSFNAMTGDGALPVGLSLGKDGNLYGTTSLGGNSDQGTVFKLTPAGVETVLYSFTGAAADGAQYPNGPLVQGRDGNLYGTTLYGGFPLSGNIAMCDAGCGTIFKITPAGNFTVVYVFGSLANGVLPQGTLIAGADGTVFGITSYGGNTTTCQMSGCGTVFQLTAAGVESVISQLDTPASGTPPQLPSSLIRADDGSLFGTAQDGEFNAGIVFKITPTGDLITLHAFRGPTS